MLEKDGVEIDTMNEVRTLHSHLMFLMHMALCTCTCSDGGTITVMMLKVRVFRYCRIQLYCQLFRYNIPKPIIYVHCYN